MSNLPMMLDIGALVVLLIFLFAGVRRGFIAAFCSLLAVVVALVGSLVIAREFSPMVIDYATPKLASSIERRLPETLQVTPENLTAEQIQSVLQQSGLPKGIATAAREQMQKQSVDTSRSISTTIAEYAVKTMAYSCVFLAAYVLLLLLWKVISHSLDLLARLPVLNLCNRTLGGAFGLVKGFILLVVLQWVLCDVSGIIAPEVIQQTWGLKWVSELPALIWSSFGTLHK